MLRVKNFSIFNRQNVYHYSKIMVLGGYGNFGKIISEKLSKKNSVSLIIAGRDLTKAQELAKTLSKDGNYIEGVKLDSESENFSKILQEYSPKILINCVGPYTDETYKIARSCIEAECDYIDLADNRDFVVNFDKLNDLAKEKKRILISGASSVPGLSTAVLKKYAQEFDQVQSLEFYINPGNKTFFRGSGTVKSVLSYCGKKFTTLKEGRWRKVTGWMGIEPKKINGIAGWRLVSYCNIPDLDLLPKHYPTLRHVIFKAGAQIKILQIGTYFFALLSRLGIVKDWAKYHQQFDTIWHTFFKKFGTDDGAFGMTIKGRKGDSILTIDHNLYAGSGDGPNIPTTPSIMLVDKIFNNSLPYGAYPCFDLFTIDEMMEYFKDFDICYYDKRELQKGIFEKFIGENNFKNFKNESKEFLSFGGECRGVFDIKRPSNFLLNLLGTLVGFPNQGQNVKCVVESEFNQWKRAFGSHRMISSWYESNDGLIIEKFGIIKFGFQLKPLKEGIGFEHITKRNWILNIPLPNFLTIKADGKTEEIIIDGKPVWKVKVKCQFYNLTFLEYEGEINEFISSLNK